MTGTNDETDSAGEPRVHWTGQPPWGLPVNKYVEVALLIGLILLLIALFTPAVHHTHINSRAAYWKNDHKQLLIAIHNFHESSRSLPAGAIVDESGRGMHGWTWLLLPGLDATPLFSFFDKHEPWNGETNDTHSRTPYSTFVHPSARQTQTDLVLNLFHLTDISLLRTACVLVANAKMTTASSP